MGVEQILHSNKGDGETSYYHNSTFQITNSLPLHFHRFDPKFSIPAQNNWIYLMQQSVLLRARQFLEGRIAQVFEQSKAECLKVVDLGCSSGPNSLLPIWEMVETIDSSCARLNMKPPVFQVFLNDLLETDFNMIFGSLVPEFHRKSMEKNKDRMPETCLIGAMILMGRILAPLTCAPSNFLYFGSKFHNIQRQVLPSISL